MSSASQRPAGGEPGGEVDDPRARARVGRADRCAQWSHRPDDAERARLAGTLGALLRELRAAYGLSIRDLAIRAAVARSSVERLETGRRRPRPSMLAALAFGLDPAAAGPLLQRLVDAAGASLRPDTLAGLRARARRTAAARVGRNRAANAVAQAALDARYAARRISTVEFRKVDFPWPKAKTNPTPAELDLEEAALNRMDLVYRAWRAADTRGEQLVDQALAVQNEAHPLDGRPWQAIADTNSVLVPPPRRSRGRNGGIR